jgi:hypothetical protein
MNKYNSIFGQILQFSQGFNSRILSSKPILQKGSKVFIANLDLNLFWTTIIYTIILLIESNKMDSEGGLSRIL